MGTKRDEIPTSTLPRRQLGRFLRDARSAAGLTIVRASALTDLSPAGLQRIESGRVQKVRKQDVRALCELYHIGARDTRRAVTLAEQARERSWYSDFGNLFDETFGLYLDLESAAQQMICYNEHIPGLLQTDDYAEAMIGACHDRVPEEELEQRLELRLKRQSLLTRKKLPLTLDVLLHESALYRLVGNAELMAAQLRHLDKFAALPNVSLRVHPYRAGLTWGILHGPFVILSFRPDPKGGSPEPSIVYREGAPSSDIYIERPDEVDRYTELSAAIRAMALTESETRDLLRQVAKEYDHEH
ncbi:helix-turn-helix domain-containing protein [Nocardia aurantia]|uniref:HTH cro/C1-type domain-containing protein n=1 Tax=Nocardia aurantia TaxID=2585199 RepID=A0A7K0DX10_9NOCA|nr:helix-turn-helix transcriptional regulator [Nocardia aurantia]MQY30255.1 hypothetical protein [Nocardia aurantia]